VNGAISGSVQSAMVGSALIHAELDGTVRRSLITT
jgi:hypothetical protein